MWKKQRNSQKIKRRKGGWGGKTRRGLKTYNTSTSKKLPNVSNKCRKNQRVGGKRGSQITKREGKKRGKKEQNMGEKKRYIPQGVKRPVTGAQKRHKKNILVRKEINKRKPKRRSKEKMRSRSWWWGRELFTGESHKKLRKSCWVKSKSKEKEKKRP